MKNIASLVLFGALALGCGAEPGIETADDPGEVGTVQSALITPVLIGPAPLPATLRDVHFTIWGAALTGHNPGAAPGCSSGTTYPLLQRVSMTPPGGITPLVARSNACTTQTFSPRSDGTHAYYIQDVAGTRSIRRVHLSTYADASVITTNANTLSVDFTNLYWSVLPPAFGAGTLRKRAIAGGLSLTHFTGPVGSTLEIVAQDATNLYFWEYLLGVTTKLKKIPLAGGAAVQLAEVPLWDAPRVGVGLDANNIYWAEGLAANAFSNSRVKRVAKAGGATSTITTVANLHLHGVGVNANKVYWAQGSTASGSFQEPTIIRSRTSPTGASGTFTNETGNRDGAGLLGGIQVGSSVAYWFDQWDAQAYYGWL